MKISIITVNLNNRPGLEATMSSVLAQTYADFEYIVIDGGSTDGSAAVIEQYADRLAYWISEPDRGVYHAMNKGIEKATGEYLLFLNSGDRLMEADTLARVQVHLNGTDLVYGNMRYDKVDSFYDATYYPDKLTLGYLYQHYLPHPATFIRHELFGLLGNYDERYAICADWAFFVKALGLHRATYVHIDEIVSIYDAHGMSAQAENLSKIKRERLELLREVFPLYADEFVADFDLKVKLAEWKKKKRYRLMKFFGWLDI